MILSKEKLRKIIKEEMTRRLQESVNPGAEVGSSIAQVIRDQLDVEGVVEFVVLHDEDDPVARPVRLEDVDHFARTAASEAAKSLLPDLEEIAQRIFRDLMRPE